MDKQPYDQGYVWADVDAYGRPLDRRAYHVAFLVVGLTLAGVLLSQTLKLAYWASSLYLLSFSGSVAFIYFPLAFILIAFFAFSDYHFPIGAALFFGSLPLSQAAASSFVLAGDGLRGGLTFEMVLAVPLILGGLLGGSRLGFERRIPGSLKAAYGGIIFAGMVATVMALSPFVGAVGFISRVLLPLLVCVAVYHRLRSIDDYKIVWFGFLIGILLITVFDFRRVVLGVVPQISREISQRYLGATGGFAIPALYIVGPALWFGFGMAMTRSLVRGIGLLLVASVLGMLFWLGGHRGPTVFLAILVLWWAIRQPLRSMVSAKGFIVTVLLVIMLFGLVQYSLSRTHAETDLTISRLGELWRKGLTSESRWFLWMKGMSAWAGSPLWGIGPNNWVEVDNHFESPHSSVVGLLVDYGVLGFGAFTLFFTKILLMARKSSIGHLSYLDQQFYLGCRAGWICMLMLLSVNLCFTSGQARNNIFAYIVFFFPMLVMTVHSRHPWWTAYWGGQSAFFGNPVLRQAETSMQQSVTGVAR